MRSFAALTLLCASVASALPASNPAEDALCGGLVDPITQFLNFQAGNVAVSVQGILKGVDGLTKESKTDENVEQIVSSATDGLAESLVNGVSAVLYGLSSGIQGAAPECKDNLQYCNNELMAAKDATNAGQEEAKDACLQAKYSCGQFYNADHINKLVPGCSQYTTSG